MKKNFLFLVCMATFFQLKAQEKSYDSIALVILDRMSDVIGDLSSCSYTLDVAIDKTNAGGIITQNNHNQVSMVGPDKMFVNVRGDKGHKGYFYNGSTVTYYSYAENNYARSDAPPTILAAIDSINEAYGIDFPAADFFYPTFTDDILHAFDEIDYVGLAFVNGEECFHISAKSKDQAAYLQLCFVDQYCHGVEVRCLHRQSKAHAPVV